MNLEETLYSIAISMLMAGGIVYIIRILDKLFPHKIKRSNVLFFISAENIISTV